jgi:hypothetical protein
MVVILKPKLCVLVLVALPAVAATARADDLKKLLNENFRSPKYLKRVRMRPRNAPGFV